MKKILFLSICILGVFLIYISSLDKKILYLSLGDEFSVGYNEFHYKDYGYSDYIRDYLKEKDVLEDYIDGFFKDNIRTTDLIRMINDNEKVLINKKTRTIKNALIKADLVTLSIGNNDIMYKLMAYKNYSEREIYDYLDAYFLDLEQLFELLRNCCKEKIIFIGYYNNLNDQNIDKYIEYINKKVIKICESYNIKYADIYNLMKNSNTFYPNKQEYIKIGEEIKKIVDKEIFKNS